MNRLLFFLLVFLVSGFSAEKMMRTTIIVDNFEGPGAGPEYGENSDWSVVGDQSVLVPNSLKFGFYKRSPGIFKSVGIKNKSEKSFGFTAKFKMRGYNWLSIEPKVKKAPYKGFVRDIALWVWGGKYDYTLEADFSNQNNEYFRIPMGSMNFLGWKLKRATVPTSIALKSNSNISYGDIGLRFSKFRVYSSRDALKDRFYAFFDYFVVTLDNSRSFYDGNDIEKDIESIFGETTTGVATATNSGKPAGTTTPAKPAGN